MNGCHNCRFHSKHDRLDPISVASSRLMKIKSKDDPMTTFICMNPQQEGKEIGREDASPPPGKDCSLWEEGKKRTALDPELERLVARKTGESC